MRWRGKMKKLSIKRKDVIQTLGLLIGILLVRVFLIDNVRVEGQSMYPTLNMEEYNDRVVVERYKHYTKNYKRGDVVILKSHRTNNDIFIKRVIGLPGETIEIKQGRVYINDNLLEEDYLSDNMNTNPQMKVVVPQGHLFVLGDNRVNSTDSRIIGTVSIDDILGQASYRFNILHLDFEKLK